MRPTVYCALQIKPWSPVGDIIKSINLINIESHISICLWFSNNTSTTWSAHLELWNNSRKSEDTSLKRERGFRSLPHPPYAYHNSNEIPLLFFVISYSKVLPFSNLIWFFTFLFAHQIRSYWLMHKAFSFWLSWKH